ncbi:MAG TPA: hypothetical protein VHT96_06320 [Clostridia bacterium]|nr:hypothetical protein [Clostridia bacterium]
MPIEDLKIKLIRNRNNPGTGLPIYTISYKGDPKRPYYPSYQILTALIGQSGVFIELNSDLTVTAKNDRLDTVRKYKEIVSAIPGIEFRSRKIPSVQRPMILGFPIQARKKLEAEELVAFIPKSVWDDEKFMEALPVDGARYYIAKEPEEALTGLPDSRSILEGFWGMAEENKAEIFKFILFDTPVLGRMGITSCGTDEQELSGLFGKKDK